ncbi:TetR/AcrR family transcriptional regulator [Arthrobacter sp. S2(2024)]|uniref:TetR/AcrR family transcriptional regulator n=1 Tax=Arthrobacter sp. S2(2024) TaxID=3111911 RepID=UPI002FC95239
MGRPSIAAERRLQIIRAASASIAEVGLPSTTLERIAAASGLSRSHIRHFLGNRDDIIEAVWAATITPYLEDTAAAIQNSDSDRALHSLVEYLFGPRLEANADDPVIEAILNGAAQDAQLQGKVYEAYGRLEGLLVQAIEATAPGVAEDVAERYAYSLLCMVMGGSSLSRLPFPASRREGARRVAFDMIDALRQKSDLAAPRNG